MAKDKHFELAAEARERAEAALEAAHEALESAHGAIEDGMEDAQRFLRRQWRQRPVTVAASALGVGLVLGLLIGSRR